MHQSAPLKLIFATLTDKKGDNVKTQAAFYDIFGGIAEVLCPTVDDQQERIRPELVISPINKYDAFAHEVITLWITPADKEKIGNKIKAMFEQSDPLSLIFSGNLVSSDTAELTDVGFCVEALRAALPVLPKIPLACITTQQLYTALKIIGGI